MSERVVSNRGERSPLVSPDLAVGSFRFWFVGQTWEWSDELARMHGYEPGEVVPTTELLEYLDSAAINALFDHADRTRLVVNPILMPVLRVSGLTSMTAVEPG
jgi:hypothetical protein